MASQKIQLLDLVTDQEKDQITKKVCSKFKQRSVKNKLFRMPVSSIFKNTLSDAIKNLQTLKEKFSNYNSSDLKISLTNSDWGMTHIEFYVLDKEPDKDFKKRVDAEIKLQIRQLNEKKNKSHIANEKKKIANKKIVLKAMQELGPEIYKVFEELNKNN
jgi:hypothetical protein